MTDPIDLNARRDERVPEPEGEPAITMPMDSDRIMFRDQAALDDYVAGANADFRAELDNLRETSQRRTPMLTDEERDRIAETLTDEPFTGPDHPMWAEVESIVRAARAQERQQVIDELHEFLPEWNYPAHVIAAISLELKDRANHTESSQNG